MRAAQWSLSVALHLALAAYSISICTASAPPVLAPLRVVFAPHPFLSHWAVSAPVAQELLDRGHRVLVRAGCTSRLWFRSTCSDYRMALSNMCFCSLWLPHKTNTDHSACQVTPMSQLQVTKPQDQRHTSGRP